MLNNLFSSFDSKNFFMTSFLAVLFYLMFFMNLNTLFLNTNNIMNSKIFFNYYNIINPKYFTKSTFFIVFIANMLSLNFFNFSLTSQASFNLPLIFMLWLPLLLISLTKKKNNFLSHLVPLSTPNILAPMMVLIELISFTIRPLTLFLRLSINMIAGHVLVTLLSNAILEMSMLFSILMYIYMLLKFMVSFIQAYIVVTLINMYLEEIYVK